MKTSRKYFSWGINALPALALALLTLGITPPAVHAAPPAYAVTDLGVLPGGVYSQGNGVNESGQVTGTDDPNNNTTSNAHAFLSGPGGTTPLKDLGTLGSINGYNGSFRSMGQGVNAGGQVAGTSTATGNASARAAGRPTLRLAVVAGHSALRLAAVGIQGTSHAFLSDPNGGALHDLGTLGGNFSEAFGVNDSGQVTGDDGRHAFLSGPNGGPLKDLGVLPNGNLSRGLGVNASGQVTGDADSTASGGYDHAFLSGPNGGPLKDLGALPGRPFSMGQGVNASGQVVGYADEGFNNTGQDHAFLSDPNGGALQDLGVLPGGTISLGFGVNDSGQVVGEGDTATAAGQATHAFLYSGGVMIDLNTLIAPNSGFTLLGAASISNNGFITGAGVNSSGEAHAYLLTPIPVNTGPKITVTAVASTANALGQRTITVTTTNTGGAAADQLQITSVTLNGAAPFPAPISPSPVPTTPNNLSNNPGSNTQQNGFVFAPSSGTKQAALHIVGHYTDPNTGIISSFTSSIRLSLP